MNRFSRAPHLGGGTRFNALITFLLMSAAFMYSAEKPTANTKLADSKANRVLRRHETVDQSQLLGVLWDDESSGFPVDLGYIAADVSTAMIKSSNSVKLASVLITRVSHTRAREFSAIPATTNWWAIELGFQLQPDAHREYFSVGSAFGVAHTTLNSEIRVQGQLSNQILYRENAPVVAGVGTSRKIGHWQFQEAPNQMNPFFEVRQPESRISSVQWQPPGQFPLDLRSEGIRLRNVIASKNSLRTESLVLVRIFMEQFYPVAAEGRYPGGLKNNMDHFLVGLSYESRERGPQFGFNAYLLLDGTLLSVNDWDGDRGSPTIDTQDLSKE